MPQRTRRGAAHKLDLMSITVLLVMAIFGGIIGYYIGISSGANQMFKSLETTQIAPAK